MWDSTESLSQALTQLCQSSKASLEDKFIKLNPRSSIEGLKDFKEYKLRLCGNAMDSTTFVIFDRDATTMLKRKEKSIVAGKLLKEFEVLIEKTYLFKVKCQNDYTNRFDQSFRVKKVCMDEKIVESFINVELESVCF
ncbi:hypothetical protein DEO72_LG2g3230 [Vigna unguiculata]|uniref:Nucleic acid-binding n=1 Tax=Vigna unguiculata TaxID=3917 RepID=A0A4D6L340_VIGUN|nr:hypothetical protein DEO72_LG2g3230 [Vigna unguiculata]